MQTTVIRLKIQLEICFASLWSSLGVRLTVETIREWEIKREYFKSHITKQRTESQNDATTVDSKTGWQDRCARPETHAWLLCQGKQTQEQNHTQVLREQLLGQLWPNGNNNRNESPGNYNYKRKLPPQLIEWTCWISLDMSLGWDKMASLQPMHWWWRHG